MSRQSAFLCIPSFLFAMFFWDVGMERRRLSLQPRLGQGFRSLPQLTQDRPHGRRSSQDCNATTVDAKGRGWLENQNMFFWCNSVWAGCYPHNPFSLAFQRGYGNAPILRYQRSLRITSLLLSLLCLTIWSSSHNKNSAVRLKRTWHFFHDLRPFDRGRIASQPITSGFGAWRMRKKLRQTFNLSSGTSRWIAEHEYIGWYYIGQIWWNDILNEWTSNYTLIIQRWFFPASCRWTWARRQILCNNTYHMWCMKVSEWVSSFSNMFKLRGRWTCNVLTLSLDNHYCTLGLLGCMILQMRVWAKDEAWSSNKTPPLLEEVLQIEIVLILFDIRNHLKEDCIHCLLNTVSGLGIFWLFPTACMGGNT